MSEWTFQARAYKVLKYRVAAATREEAEKKARVLIEKEVADDDFRD